MSEKPFELDVREIPPFRRHPEIFRTFDDLKTGEAFILINDHDPKPLLYQFQFERNRSFDWSVLESGPQRYRIEIRKRIANGSRNVTEYLGGDHKRLDSIITYVEKSGGAGSNNGMAERFSEFACGLSKHIDAEENILFPIFEKITGMTTQGPTAVMRSEHADIKKLLLNVQAAIKEKNDKEAKGWISSLKMILGEHNMKEEHILYPAVDRGVGGERETDDLVKKMQAYY